MNLRHGLRQLALRCLPDSLLQQIKKVRYANELAGAWEQHEPDTQVVRHLVRPGGLALDIGANFGKYTKLLSDLVGPAGRVFSVEPIPLTYELLVANVRRFGLANVQTINAAVSETDAEVHMQVPHYPSGGENFYEARIVAGQPPAAGLRQVRVSARSLDSLFGPLRNEVDFIKCDVEGHELSCVQGAAALLSRGKPAWLIEVSGKPDNPDSRAAQLFAILTGHGYEPFYFDGKSLRPRPAGHRSLNYFFLTASHLAGLPRSLQPDSVGVTA